MLRLAEFVVTQASTDYIEVWNSWINTGINIPQGAMPTLLAVIRELVLIDKGTLKEVIRVEKTRIMGYMITRFFIADDSNKKSVH